MELVKESILLESLAKSGKTKYWKAKVVTDKKNFFIQKEFWQGSGKHQISDPYLIEGKNTGKSNETSDKVQALLELDRIVKKQEDSGYRENGIVYDGRPLPMTAYSWKNRKDAIKYPCGIQAKWDGIRCCQYESEFWSRKGKIFVNDLISHLKVKSKYILDGELVIEGETFQTISSYVKKVQDDQARLEFHVFDLMIENMPFQKRYELLQKESKKFPANVKLSPTFFAMNDEEVMEHHRVFTEFFDYNSDERNKMGYFEGTMIRNLNGLYKINHRSSDLLKLKDFVDEEYEIVGFYEGKGRNAGSITFICKIGDEEFHVNPKGTMDYRKKLWDNRDRLKGKFLTVEFQEKTERGVPRFPVGKAIRDYE